MKGNIKKVVLSSLTAALLIGCGGGSSTSSIGGAGGGAAKGPFKEGSVVTATELTVTQGSTTEGKTQTSSIDNKGKFSISVPWNGLTELKVTGSYLDENTGKFISGGELRAIVNMKEGVIDDNININILTHIASDNIIKSLEKASLDSNSIVTIESAKISAKQKVAKAFKIDLKDGADLENLDLTNSAGGNSVANTQLLKLSASLLKTDSPEDTLNQIVADIEEDGEINAEAVNALAEIKLKEKEVVLSEIASNIEQNIETDNVVPRSDDLLNGKLSLDNDIEFNEVQEAIKNTEYISNEVLVNGIYGGIANISVSAGAQISISSVELGAWKSSTDTNLKVSNGDILKVKATASDSYDTKTTSSVTIGGVDIDFDISTESNPEIEDKKVKQFYIETVKNVSLDTEATSSEILVEGINTNTNVSIENGSFRIIKSEISPRDLEWVTSGVVKESDKIIIKNPSSSNYGEAVKSILTIGEGVNAVKSAFVSINMVQDKVPNDNVGAEALKFVTSYDTELSNSIDKEIIFTGVAISGITGDVNVEVVNGKFTKDGGTTWITSGIVNSGDNVSVKHTASKNYSTKTVSSLVIGRTITDFISFTKAEPNVEDTTVQEFTFEVKTNTDKSDLINSNEITISGITVAVPISIEDGEYSINSGTFVSTAGTVADGDKVVVRHTSNEKGLEKTESKLKVGEFETKFISFTSAPDDIIPATFSLGFKNNVELSSEVISNEVEIKGINKEVDVTIQNGEFTKDAGSSWSTTGTVQNGDKIKIRHTSNSSNLEKTETNVVIGAFETKFVSITKQEAPVNTSTAPTLSVFTESYYEFIPSASRVSSWKIVNKPAWASFNSITGKLSGTPSSISDQGISAEIIITAINNGGETSLSPFTITVKNFVPVLTPEVITKTITKGSSFSYDVTLEDKGSDTKIFTLENAPSFVSIDSATGTISGTAPEVSSLTEYPDFTIKVTDGSSATDTITVKLTVDVFTSLPSVPVISGTPNTTITQDGSYSFTPNANDANSANLTFSIQNKPSWSTFNTETGTLTGTPTNSDVGIYSNIIISVTEGSDTVSLNPFSITVDDVNDIPSGLVDTAIVDEDGEVLIDVLSNDIDADEGDILSIDSVTASVNSTAIIENGKIKYTPNENFNGTDTITYVVKDNQNAKSTETSVTITVNPVNDIPNGLIDTAIVDEDGEILIDVLANDTDVDVGDTLSIDSVTASVNSTAIIENGKIKYTPNENFNGTDTITYVVKDDKNGKSTETSITITVNSINDAPIAIADVATVVVNSQTQIDVLANDTDIDSTNLSIDNISVQPLNGVASIENGKILYSPMANYTGSDSITYIVKDDEGLTSTTTVSITVSDIVLTKAFLLGKKLVNDGETYLFRENDIVLADSGEDITSFLSYGSVENGKVKVMFDSGEYDLISKSSNGYTIEFYEYSGDTIVSTGSVETNNSLVTYSFSDFNTAFSDLGVETINVFDYEFSEIRNNSKYFISGNNVMKDLDSETLLLNTFNSDSEESRSEARIDFNKPKTSINAKVRLKEANIGTSGQVIAIMKDINDAENRIYSIISLHKNKINYYVGRFDSTGNTELEEIESGTLVTVDTVSEDGAFKFVTKIDVIGSDIKFTVQKVDGLTAAEIGDTSIQTVSVETSYDLGIDRVQLRAKSDLTSESTLPSEITKFRVHSFEAKAGEDLNTNVQDAIAILESIDPETEDINTKLTSAENTLAAVNTEDAILAKTLIAIVKIANNDAISNLVSITAPSGVSTQSYLNQFIRATVLENFDFDHKLTDASTPIFTTSFTTVFHNIAEELNTLASNLDNLFPDSTKVFGYDGESMNYNEAMALRASLLAAAFKLEYLSAYQYATDEDVLPRDFTSGSDTSEYMNINIDPASVLNNGNFMKLVNSSRVDTAKSYAIAALETADKLPLGFEDITVEDKTNAKDILDALNGTASGLLIEVDDDEIKSYTIDLAKMFSSSGALRISDFGSSWQITCEAGFTYNLTESKKEDEIICTNNSNSWMIGDVEPTVDPTSASSGIDEIVLNLTKNDNTILSGQNLIDFILE